MDRTVFDPEAERIDLGVVGDDHRREALIERDERENAALDRHIDEARHLPELGLERREAVVESGAGVQ
jgi:hypothetical protein